VVEELHETHPGICKMKSLTRSYVWWPNMDNDLENKDSKYERVKLPDKWKESFQSAMHPWECQADQERRSITSGSQYLWYSK
jgi:hypothetical protein